MEKSLRRSAGLQVLCAFGTICAILIAGGLLLFFSLRTIEHHNQVQEIRALDKLALIDDTAEQVSQVQAAVLLIILENDSTQINALDQTISQLNESNTVTLAQYQMFLEGDKEKQLFSKLIQSRAEYWKQTQPVLVLSRSNKDAEATKLIDTSQAFAYSAYLKNCDELIDFVEARAHETTNDTINFIARIRIICDILLAIAILICIGAGFFFVKVAQRLNQDNEILQKEIQERKRTEESLRLLQSAVEQSKDSIIITDAVLNPPGPRIVFANSAFNKLTGYTSEEVIGKTPRILQGPRTDRAVLDRLRENLHRGDSFHGETINYRKDGTEFDLEWQIAPIRNGHGETTHFVAIQRDITQRKMFEARMIQSQKMETVGKLAGGIAHEFNSIMTAIIGQSELLLADIPSSSPLCKSAQEIRQAADRASSLTRQLLAFGRKQLLRMEAIDLNALLAGMEGTLRHLMTQNTDVRIIPAPELHLVKADRSQIEQVILNVAMNAADAMPNGGKFTIETSNLTLDSDSISRWPDLKPGDYVMLAITDTGAGMSDQIKARLFEPFFSTKEVGQGTGLGLATCYGIVKQCGGHISVYSEPGRGATFKIYLPQTESIITATAPGRSQPNLPRGAETILLVEDDPALREMATTLLLRLGYTVHAAADGVEALKVAHQPQTGHIDLLFTDVVMPHMSGKELSDRVRSLFPKTRILFTSAYTENAISHQGALDPSIEFLQKPFTPSALANRIRQTLDA